MLFQRPLGQLQLQPMRQFVGLAEVDVEQGQADAQRADLAECLAVNVTVAVADVRVGIRSWRCVSSGRRRRLGFCRISGHAGVGTCRLNRLWQRRRPLKVIAFGRLGPWLRRVQPCRFEQVDRLDRLDPVGRIGCIGHICKRAKEGAKVEIDLGGLGQGHRWLGVAAQRGRFECGRFRPWLVLRRRQFQVAGQRQVGHPAAQFQAGLERRRLRLDFKHRRRRQPWLELGQANGLRIGIGQCRRNRCRRPQIQRGLDQ